MFANVWSALTSDSFIACSLSHSLSFFLPFSFFLVNSSRDHSLLGQVAFGHSFEEEKMKKALAADHHELELL